MLPTATAVRNAPVWGPAVCVCAIVAANVLAWALNERSWPFRRLLAPLGVPPLFFTSNRAPGVSRHTRPASYWAFDLLDPSHLVQSPCGLSPWVLLVLHAATIVALVVAFTLNLAVDFAASPCPQEGCLFRGHGAADWPTFLTNWTFALLGLAGATAFCNTARFLAIRRRLACAYANVPPGVARQDSDASTSSVELFDNPGCARQASTASSADSSEPAVKVVVLDAPEGGIKTDAAVLVQPLQAWDWLSRLHCVLMETACSACLFVSLWFWLWLFATGNANNREVFEPNASMLLEHAGNTALALLQATLTRLPFVSTHFQVVLWFELAYSVLLWTLGATTGVWRYQLSWRNKLSAGAFVIFPVIVFVIFCAWFVVALLREGAAAALCSRARRAAESVQRGQPEAPASQCRPAACV